MTRKSTRSEYQKALELAACTRANPRKASRGVTQSFDAALRPAGLKATRFTVLATLANLGAVPLTRLSEAIVMDRTTSTRNLKPLLGKGWIRVDQGTDQRVRGISLPDAGRSVFDAVLPPWRETRSAPVESLGSERRSEFLDDLEETVMLAKGR